MLSAYQGLCLAKSKAQCIKQKIKILLRFHLPEYLTYLEGLYCCCITLHQGVWRIGRWSLSVGELRQAGAEELPANDRVTRTAPGQPSHFASEMLAQSIAEATMWWVCGFHLSLCWKLVV